MKKILFSAAVLWVSAVWCVPVCADGNAVVYRLKWKFNTSVAGDIFADTAGYFERAGLTVDVKAGGIGIDAIRELELKRAHFGVASADQVILALEKGARIMVIAQLFQANPLQWIYRADQPRISSLSDLKGRRIGVTFGGNDDAIMATLLARGHLKRADVRIISVQGNAIPFFKKDADLWPVYRNSQGVSYADKLAKEGEQTLFFNPRDFGVSFVANSVITTKEMIDTQPGLVTAFLSALLDAWGAAMADENRDRVLAAVKKLDGGINDKIRQKQLTATRKLVQPDPGIRIGHIDVPGWEQTESILLSEGQIKKKVGIAGFLVQLN